MVHLELSKEEIEIIIDWAESVEDEFGNFDDTDQKSEINLARKLKELLKSI